MPQDHSKNKETRSVHGQFEERTHLEARMFLKNKEIESSELLFFWL
jgi:hypothetical protein